MHTIAIDGPAGAGKSTIARKVAAELGYIYVDTGAMYRSIALYLLRHDISKEEEHSIMKVCPDIQVSIDYQNGEQQIILNGENVNDYIRTEEVSMMTSCIAKYRCVREKLLFLQRDMARTKDVIMDGRDIGTCVLPEAQTKIFLTASVEERARRRFLEQTQRGISCDIHDIEADIAARDKQDMNREISPLQQADDAALVDTSHMNIQEVVQCIISIHNKNMQS